MPYEPHVEMPALFTDIERIGATRKLVARLGDLQENILNRGANGERILTWPEFRVARGVVDDLIVLKSRAGDIPIDWLDIPAVRKLFNDLRAEKTNPPAPLSDSESQVLARFTRGASVSDLALESKVSPMQMVEHLEGLFRRANRLREMAATENKIPVNTEK